MSTEQPLDAIAVRLYDELHRLARARMANLPPQTLQATSLVNEVYMRLKGEGDRTWETDGEFFGAAAEAMRRVLVDHARQKFSQKRGGGWNRQSIDERADAFELRSSPGLVLEINESLERLDNDDPELATIVKLRVFIGLTTEEIGSLLDVSRKTIERRWRFAAATLRSQLSEDDPLPEAMQ